MFLILCHTRPLVLVLALALFGAEASHASAQTGSAEYETLMTELSEASSRSVADRLAAKIWQIWLTAPDAAAQEVLDAAMRRRQAHDFVGAISQLDRLVKSYPDYAEGWNQRATMYFMVGDFTASLADVEEVLLREPRHFGALSGKAMILFRQGLVPLAHITLREALKHHPFLREGALLHSAPGTEL